MRLEEMTVVARQRSVGEVHDVALLLIRRHAVACLGLGLLGFLPWALLDWWLVSLIDQPKVACWLVLVLAFAQAPAAGAGLTAYLGAAMFESRPTLRASVVAGFHAQKLLLLVALWRAMCAASVVLLPWSAGYVAETVLLERQNLRGAWRRANALAAAARGSHLMHMVLAGISVVVAVWIVDGTGHAFLGLLRSGELWGEREDLDVLPGHHVLPTIALWMATVYITVVRFCAYIDARTRHECWDIELDLRRAGARVAGHS